LHHVYEECVKDANEMNVSTCGSQLVGLVPLEAFLSAADYYIKNEKLLILEEPQKVKLVIQRLGLNSLSTFNPKERIIEYVELINKILLKLIYFIFFQRYLIQERLEKDSNKYQTMPVKSFIDAIQARTAIPGGGCVAALGVFLK
jgi:glutamate formiminotransferase / formiminotetrahydrofolate cyclodeaminase